MSSPRQLLLHMPPEASGAPSNPQSPITTAVGAASTALIDTKIDIGNAGCTKQMVTFDTDQDVYIRFGDATMTAAVAGDWIIRAVDGPVTFLLDSRRTRFYRALQVTAAAALRSYVSG